MTPLIVTFLVVALIPLLVGTWRVSLLGLSLQGFLLGWIAMTRIESISAEELLLLSDLLLLRAVFAPGVLYRVLRDSPRRNDIIPANLLYWFLVAGLVLLSFRFSHLPALAAPERSLPLIGVATAALLLGFLVVAVRKSPVGQTIGVLRIENAIALFELAGPHHPPLPIQLGLMAVYVLTLLTFASFLKRLSALDARPAPHPGALL